MFPFFFLFFYFFFVQVDLAARLAARLQAGGTADGSEGMVEEGGGLTPNDLSILPYFRSFRKTRNDLRLPDIKF